MKKNLNIQKMQKGMNMCNKKLNATHSYVTRKNLVGKLKNINLDTACVEYLLPEIVLLNVIVY